MTDPIADMLTRIRNAIARKKNEVVLPFSKMKFAIVKILEKEKFIGKVEIVEEDYKQIKIVLKYTKDNESVINSLKRISKSGRRVYANRKDIPRVLEGSGIIIVSTSRGLMVDTEARIKRLGGEIICEIY